MFQCVALLALVAIAAAFPAEYQQSSYGHGGGGGGGGGGYGKGYDDYQVPIDYNFKYDVKDDYTYNEQSREENKYGDVITGQYSLREPDGAIRIVKYTADDYGFHATVNREGGYGPSYSAPSSGYNKQPYH